MASSNRETTVITAELASATKQALATVPDNRKLIDLIRRPSDIRRVPYVFEEFDMRHWYKFVDSLSQKERSVLNKTLGQLARTLPKIDGHNATYEDIVIHDWKIGEFLSTMPLGNLRQLSVEELQHQYGLSGLGFQSLDFLIEIGLLVPTHRDV